MVKSLGNCRQVEAGVGVESVVLSREHGVDEVPGDGVERHVVVQNGVAVREPLARVRHVERLHGILAGETSDTQHGTGDSDAGVDNDRSADNGE